jgi:hypothetical protein
MATLVLLGWFISSSLRLPFSRPGIRRPRRTAHGIGWSWIIALILASWTLWFLTYQSNRFLMPTIALLFPAAAVALVVWSRHVRPYMPAIAALCFAAALAYTALADWILIMEPGNRMGGRHEAIATAIGAQDRQLYLAHRLNYYRAARWMSDPQSRRPDTGEVIDGVLLVGEHRTLYFDLPVIASDWFDTPQPLPLIRSTPNNGILFDRLLAGRHSYIALNAQELSFYHNSRFSYFRPRFTDEEYARFEALWDSPRLKLVKRFYRPGIEDMRIYRILPRSADRPHRENGEQ